jgi:hypothetical protein
MKEGFWSGLIEHFLFWGGLVFTIGGTIASLAMGREFAWIGVLFVIAGLLAFFTFALQKHRHLLEAQQNHREEVSNLKEDINIAMHRAAEAERRLNAIPADLLKGLHETVRSHSFVEVARLLADYARYIKRMRKLVEAEEMPIRLKSFVKRDGILYAVAGLKKEFLAHLEDDDFFVLEFKDGNGLVTRSAHLFVHQRDPTKEVVWFRVDRFLGDEMAHVDALADKQDVPAKGYFARVDADLTQYANFGSVEIVELLRRLASDVARRQD